MQHHRDSMYVEPKRTWSRHPAGGWLGMVALRLWHQRGLCWYAPRVTRTPSVASITER
jgi:hypothetical protein